MDTIAAIRQTFFQECEEQLAEMETALLAIEGGDSDHERVNAVFRAVHSIKGGAGAFHLDDLVSFAHTFETLLEHVRIGRVPAGAQAAKAMLRAADVLADLVRAVRDGRSVEHARTLAQTAELADLMPAPVGPAAGAHGEVECFEFKPVKVSLQALQAASAEVEANRNIFTIRFDPRRELYAKANEPLLVLRELARLGTLTVRCDWSGLPPLPQLDPEGAYLTFMCRLESVHSETAVRDTFEFVAADCELGIEREPQVEDAARRGAGPAGHASERPKEAAARTAPGQSAFPRKLTVVRAEPAAASTPAISDGGHTAPRPGETTIRVDLERVDRLADLVGELAINQAILARRMSGATAGAISQGHGASVLMVLDELEQLTRVIRESVMAIRAQPVKVVFQRMPRLAREVAELTAKSVHLVMEGESTEVDRTVIERLADPLTHMIRNAIDHGIESPAQRRAAGKPEQGTVRLTAMHRSGRIVIEVADDGGGIDRRKLRDIAMRNRLIAADAQLSEEEIDNLIFLPGFSTAATLSNVSGRGVGMDVVRKSVQALGGRISITSRPRVGSVFTLILPLTLAVLDGMMVRVAEQTLVVPLTTILETLQPKRDEIHVLAGNAHVISVRDKIVPLTDVGLALGYRSQAVEPGSGVALLIETAYGAREALLVDAIEGQQQVVIKSLEANYGFVAGIAGATILGDGQVALIVDVDGLVAGARVEPNWGQPNIAAAG